MPERRRRISEDSRRPVRARGSQRRRPGLLALTVAVGAGFLLGVFSHRQGAIGYAWAMLRQPARTAVAVLRPSGLPTLRIEMKDQHFIRIQEARQESLANGYVGVSDRDFVPARIHHDGRVLKVEMRLKGDMIDHLRTDKWSYRIHVKDGDQLFGMRRFSIQHPKTRNYHFEYGWHANLHREGIVAPRYFFVQVFFNNRSLGVFALEEHFSVELLESQERREGILLSFHEDAFSRYVAGLDDGLGRHIIQATDHRDALIEISRASRVERDPVLSRQRDAAIGLLRSFQEGQLGASQVFDAKLLARYFAVSRLWNVIHGMIWANVHFYYNPITAKLEPVGFDGKPARRSELRQEPAWVTEALRDPAVAESYVGDLLRVSRPEYLDELLGEIEGPVDAFQRAYHLEFPSIGTPPLRSILGGTQEQIRRSLEVTQPLLAFVRDDGPDGALALEVRNLLDLPVEILAVDVGGTRVPAARILPGAGLRAYARNGASTFIVDGAGPAGFGEGVLRLPADLAVDRVGREPLDVRVESRLLGMPTSTTSAAMSYPPALDAGPLPEAPTVEEALAKHPFLAPGDAEDALVLRPGIWDVDGDLVLPAGVRLRAEAGTTLRFAPEAVFLARGPLDFEGTDEAPVTLAPQLGSWPGLAVLDAGERSVWRHVVVEATHGIERGGWILTGGITFYRSPLELRRSRIRGSLGEDALNLVRSPFLFRDSEFVGAASDAFDGDFSNGEIEGCSFYDVAGDAVDVSGSRVEVRSVDLAKVGDKGLSVGEGSQVTATDVRAFEVGIAVASKDLSSVRLEGAVIASARHAGLAVFQKKPQYGPASIEATDVQFLDTPQESLVQTSSWLELDGVRIEGSELDVRRLYEVGILGN